MLDRSSSSSVGSLFFSLAALATGGFLLLQPTPRELGVQEKHALRGGDNDTFPGKCCQPITGCFTLPNNNTCGWYTTNGMLTCSRGFASQYTFNDNNLSCTGFLDGVNCSLGAADPCILVESCKWNPATGECVGSGNENGSQPGYASCTPNCPS
jgi:hypothetical protein